MSPYSVSPREEVLVKQSSELVSSKEKGQVWSTLVREAGDGQRGQRNAPAQGRLPYVAGRQRRAVLGTRAGEHRPLVHLQTTLKRSYPLPLSAPAHSNPGLRVSNYLPPPPPPGEKKKEKKKKKKKKKKTRSSWRLERKGENIRWRLLYVIGPLSLPNWPPFLLMNKRKVRTYQISLAAACSLPSPAVEHFCTTYPADRSRPLAFPLLFPNPVARVASPPVRNPSRRAFPAPVLPGTGCEGEQKEAWRGGIEGRRESEPENKYINKDPKKSTPQPLGSGTSAGSAGAGGPQGAAGDREPGLLGPRLPVSFGLTSGRAWRVEADLGLECLFV